MRTVLVGIDPGNNEGGPLSVGGSSGRRLASLCGLSGEEYEARFDRVNLHPVRGVPASEDWRAAENLLPSLRGRRVMAMGGRVARALLLPQETMRWTLAGGFVGMTFPHPSGLSRWWNDPSNVDHARSVMTAQLRPCVHVEGADGSGKTTLVEDLSVRLNLIRVGSEDPPSDHGECLRRVEARLHPGTVCDRSSGLVSELVYGPVLRGGVLGGEEEMWGVVRSLVHAITFVYCRPPTEAMLDPGFRDGEDPEHVRGVREGAARLVERYDVVMARLSGEGARVIRYDRTRQTPEEVAACVG